MYSNCVHIITNSLEDLISVANGPFTVEACMHQPWVAMVTQFHSQVLHRKVYTVCVFVHSPFVHVALGYVSTLTLLRKANVYINKPFSDLWIFFFCDNSNIWRRDVEPAQYKSLIGESLLLLKPHRNVKNYPCMSRFMSPIRKRVQLTANPAKKFNWLLIHFTLIKLVKKIYFYRI